MQCLRCFYFSEYPISLTVTKLLDTVVGPIPLWHIHGGKMYRVKSGLFGQTANFARGGDRGSGPPPPENHKLYGFL